jgi:hypothetical protein
MTPFDKQIRDLINFVKEKFENGGVTSRPLSGGVQLIEVTGVVLPPGWSAQSATIVFLAPAGYPGAKPDCFWVTPAPLRLANGSMPQAANDGNLIPDAPPRVGTWFSWHLQAWSPNRDSLVTYFAAIMQRFNPAR